MADLKIRMGSEMELEFPNVMEHWESWLGLNAVDMLELLCNGRFFRGIVVHYTCTVVTRDSVCVKRDGTNSERYVNKQSTNNGLTHVDSKMLKHDLHVNHLL